MLPSMPILFTRDSQDAFGNKIEPSTSCFNQNNKENPIFQSEVVLSKIVKKEDNTNNNGTQIKPNDIQKEDTIKKDDDNLLETALIRSYYTKVQSRFTSHPALPSNKFVQFRDILKSFDPMLETPVDLYRKIEKHFGNEHADIVEEFLLFLKPGQAAQVGRFMDHLMLTKMTGFIQLLQTTFSRKPTVLRKIMRTMTSGLNNGTSDEMKARVLPHLRSSPQLTQMFKTLFPDERPPDSLYESGTDSLDEGFLTCDRGYEVFEFEDKAGKRKETKGLDSEYLHGRVFIQHGRMLRNASVIYPYSKEPYRVHARRLAPNHCISPPESDSERSSPKRSNKSVCKLPQKRSRKQLKSPTKTVKDVNDNTKKECVPNSFSNKIKGKSHCKNKNCKKDDIALKKNVSTKRDDAIKEDTPKNEVRSWTREEDKTMLEVLKGEPGSELVFGRIRELLPHRTTAEIKDRFCHVMHLLQQMAVGEVNQ
ncbi:unnamed protein product [Danaus chrysippus]|uniref:(African queen) hypothetical protein n=1 Tax=Danaus chrysippus TaxID=151541 RepID=A0A8J2QIK0_9NEOP|nr:unnamed protein product [Danaus chrysippus]